ncbi:peptidase M56 [Tumebacillus lipolyticus]|uniref:Peptidase M56 n=1 Tax=Tumebacillus lipolyticus TaxID=1280370 RepID=A0ABW4ZW04_9BACL
MRNYVGLMLGALARRKWKRYVSSQYGVAFEHPPNWIEIEKDRYQGRDGFFELSAAAGAGGLEDVCRQEAYHRFQPYGTDPTIKFLKYDARDACYIFPSEDQPKEMKAQAAFYVEYPVPLHLHGETYRYLVFWSDEGHIRNIVRKLKFL